MVEPRSPSSAGSTFGADLAERTGMTALQVGIGYAVVEAFGWPDGFAIVIAAVLAVVKGLLARYVGRPHSASLVPAVPALDEPPPPPPGPRPV